MWCSTAKSMGLRSFRGSRWRGGKLVEPGGKLDEMAKRHDATTSQLSVAWLLHHSPVILPIPGTSSVKHLDENVAAAHVKLSDAEWAEIEAAAK